MHLFEDMSQDQMQKHFDLQLSQMLRGTPPDVERVLIVYVTSSGMSKAFANELSNDLPAVLRELAVRIERKIKHAEILQEGVDRLEKQAQNEMEQPPQ